MKLNDLNTKSIHFIFLFILSLNYLIPILLFGEITLFYKDALDSEIVYNHVISQRLLGVENPTDIFLNGVLSLDYMRRVFNPYMILYGFLNTELAYWVTDISVKLTSYLSFFVLAKKINKNLFLCSLVSCLYACVNLPTLGGFGMAIVPYLFYLIIFRKNLKLKHYLIVIFFGLNSDFILTIFAIPVLILSLFFFIKKKNLNNLIQVFTLFIIAIFIVNWNLINLTLQGVEFHRSEFLRDKYSIYEAVIYFLRTLIKIPTSIDYKFSINIPYTLFLIPLILLVFSSKEKKIKKIFSLIIFSSLFQAFLKIEIIANYIYSSPLNNFDWDYISQSYFFLYCLILILILKKDSFFVRPFIFILFFCVIIFQVNSSAVPFYKEKILKIENYRNLYTFNGYYNFYDYPSIKKIVKNERVISVGLDPMIAPFHNIKVNDGYHNLYPLFYKNKFRKIIKDQLSNSDSFKNYYNNYGSRLYTFLSGKSDPKNIVINYEEAKNLKTKYIISKYELSSNKIDLVYGDCNQNKFCLYRIK